MTPVTIYHNPKCGTSRNTLALIRDAGIEPTVVEYLKTPLPQKALQQLIEQMGATPRDILRSKETLYAELNLAQADLSDDALVAAMTAHPILMNRPIVVTSKGALLCRPAELVLNLLPTPQ